MKITRDIMGMHITVEIIDASDKNPLEKVFAFFTEIDERFSTYKDSSEISKINRGELLAENASAQMKEIFQLSEITKKETNGYFDIRTPEGKLDPSGLVKGWAIWQAAELIEQLGFKNFYVEAGGDVQASGRNAEGQEWSVGIKNPFNTTQIVKVLRLRDEGLATSGTYERGRHIYNPHQTNDALDEVVSVTVIGPNVYQADRFATAAFAMGREGINFIEKLAGFEGYMIDSKGMATYTSGFNRFVV